VIFDGDVPPMQAPSWESAGAFRLDSGHSDIGPETQINRSKSARTKFQGKRFKIRQFGLLISVYPVQSVHAPLIHRFNFSYPRAGIMIGRLNGVVGNFDVESCTWRD
jgi:hypothetical protein